MSIFFSEPQPTIGTRATCQMCGEAIEYIGPHWQHLGESQPRHPALPVTASNCPQCDELRRQNAKLLTALSGFLWVGNNIEAMHFDPIRFRKFFEAAIEDGRAIYNEVKEIT